MGLSSETKGRPRRVTGGEGLVATVDACPVGGSLAGPERKGGCWGGGGGGRKGGGGGAGTILSPLLALSSRKTWAETVVLT